jgi:topoisomerase-4 subunit B
MLCFMVPLCYNPSQRQMYISYPKMAKSLLEQGQVNTTVAPDDYSAKDIEVLEGLEPVRMRPGMYIGGTDVKALHHLVSEVVDNSMDEAVAGHANRIKVHMHQDGSITIGDNGRGIPVDPHPKFKDKSALEVILTTLHSGGKFTSKAYSTSGGLHGVGISVVNALSHHLQVSVLRAGVRYTQRFAKGLPLSKLEQEEVPTRGSGTTVTFMPDDEIFKGGRLKPETVYNMIRSKAYLFRNVKIEWKCDPELLPEGSSIPQATVIHFPNGIVDYLKEYNQKHEVLALESFADIVEFPDNQGKLEWAINWIADGEAIFKSYCNTIPTPQGGTHEAGLRSVLLKGLKRYGEMIGNKKAANLTADDIFEGFTGVISIYITNPSFQGQTKDKLLNQEAAKLVENAVKDRLDHWLSGDPKTANAILELAIEYCDDRLKRKKSKEVNRKSPIKSLRLPGKLADCHKSEAKDTELFIVEGDSAGGSAKQARNRDTQAILPIKGKILNVASSTLEKIKANQEVSNLITALGCETGKGYRSDDLRYERIIIMTDADVDGAHISSLLMTFFFLQMPKLITDGHLYLAQPPLYRVVHSNKSHYVQTDEEKDALVQKFSAKKGKLEISRFKGLGEMTPAQLKETTMNPATRSLYKVVIAEDAAESCDRIVDDLMGKNPEKRFNFIRDNSQLLEAESLDA